MLIHLEVLSLKGAEAGKYGEHDPAMYSDPDSDQHQSVLPIEANEVILYIMIALDDSSWSIRANLAVYFAAVS